MENKNIFENAKFGELFITRNGHKACYLGPDRYGYHPKIKVQDYYGGYNPEWNWDGTDASGDSQWDIAGKGSYKESSTQLHETINADGLNKIAIEWAKDDYGMGYKEDDYNIILAIENFKAGYRKALEHLVFE